MAAKSLLRPSLRLFDNGIQVAMVDAQSCPGAKPRPPAGSRTVRTLSVLPVGLRHRIDTLVNLHQEGIDLY
jgi:hypothetical protein